MRVLTIIDSLSFGGAENLLAVLAGVAPEAGMQLDVWSLAPWSAERTAMQPVLEEAGLAPRFLGIPRLADARAIPRISAAIRRSGADVVHAHLGYSATLVPPAAALARRPVVSTLHHVPGQLGRGERLKERLSIESASRAHALILVSEASRREFARRYGHRPSWRVIHNGVDLSRFSPDRHPLPDDIPVPDGATVVSVIAALRRPKRHDVLVEAWPQVLRSDRDAHLLVVGDGEQRDHLEAQIEQLGVTDRVHLLGARADVPAILRATDLAVLASDTEALPTTLIEAAASGVPAVATRVGGTSEVVVNGETGLLVAPGRPDELARAVSALLLDHERRRAMGCAARAWAVERFDARVWAESLHALYEDALAGRANAS